MTEPMVSATAFSRAAGVTQGAISHALKSGRLQAYSKSGRRLSASAKGPKFFKLEEAQQSFQESRIRPPTNGSEKKPTPRGLVLLTEKTKSLQNELLEMRISKERGELITLADVRDVIKTIGRAVRQSHKAGSGWSEELCGAFQAGGVGSHCALLRAKFDELDNSLANFIMAEAERCAEPKESAVL